MQDHSIRKLEEYNERYLRFSKIAREQLSFFNNLLLTLGGGSLTYVASKTDDIQLNLCSPVTEPTLIGSSLFLMGLSVAMGLLVNMNRIYDFRLSRRIALARKKVLEQAYRNNKEAGNDGFKISQWLFNGDTPNEYKFYEKPLLAFYRHPIITSQMINNYVNDHNDSKKDTDTKDLKEEFHKLREITHNLGIRTWRNTNHQIAFFAFSILAYIISILV